LLLLDAVGVRLPAPGVILAVALIVVGLAQLARAAHRPSPLLLAAGFVLTAILLAGDSDRRLGGVDFGLAEQRTSEEFTVSERVSEIVIDLDAGSVRIMGGSQSVDGSYTARYRNRRPAVERSVSDGTLHIDAECPSLQLRILGTGCRVDLEVRVPSDVRVEVEAGSGTVSVERIRGDVEVDTGSGGITIDDVDGAVRTDTGSGGIRLGSVRGSVEAETGSGSITGAALQTADFTGSTGSGGIDLEFWEVRPERIELQTGSGSVRVRVPQGTYAVDVDAGAGRTSVEGIEEDPGASHRIRIRSGSGSVTVSSTSRATTTPVPTPEPTPEPAQTPSPPEPEAQAPA
jgi:hypothetical protein